MNLAKNKSALITGASSGIGKATALAFAKVGIDVVLVSRTQEKLAAVASAVEQTKAKATTYALDLADIEKVREKISAIAANTKVDILINSAGMGYTGNLSDTPLSDWQAVMNLNLTSVFQCILGVLPTMRDRGTGTIVNVASVAGLQPFPSWGAYSVSKAGLIALSKTLAAEERQNGIRVTTICPGAVNTELWNSDTVRIKLERSAMLTPESVAQSILHTVLLPEQAVIEELTLMPSTGVL
ncbi:SDR family oxidoreductase [Chroogloeocystis siderophila]|jgi:short-subunit dehydrogenase|uniref:Short-chain dehydrogenase n=1 Tax=Chroogloeocystis siderophila 5.2 s.c.1 TaxID=247279 RepID=A0A1U7HFY1_9CHRO|nr:SDR family oxidoreductase [Chroogloeocystis siderophila]OKH22486.1 short-chain dehydrogenase [Chroogloeocystis siderophila 5.2 s.c.1]